MKKRMIITVIMVLIIALFSYEVKAFENIEIDPDNKITMPSSIYNSKGTISASSGTIYYQKVDLTNDQFTKVENKITEQQNYVKTEKAKLEAEKAEIEELVEKLKEKYKGLISEQGSILNLQILGDSAEGEDEGQQNQEETGGPTIKETIENDEDYKAYEKKVEAYNEHVETYNQKLESLQKEFYALIPKYNDSSWTQTTNTTSNVSLDFTGKSGQVNFVLWAKLVDSSKTYYDFSVYSTEIKESEPGKQEDSGNQKDPGSTDEPTTSESDFSKAKFEVKSTSFTNLNITVSNYTIKEGSNCYIYVSKNNNETFTSMPENASIIDKKDGKAVFPAKNAQAILELAGKNYIYVLERVGNSINILTKQEMKDVPLPSLGTRLDIFLYNANATDVLNSIGLSDGRKINYKIGKITSNDILRAFKKESSNSAFSKLLAYAKSSNYMAEGTIGLEALNYNLVKDLNIEEDCYYFVYMQVDSENGKYVDVEDVAIYQECNGSDGKAITHFAFADINVDDEEPTTNDTTVAPDSKLPQTGISYAVVVAIAFIAVAGTIGFSKYKKYKDIK